MDEAFYEFSEGDLARVMASYASQRVREEGGHLMTRQVRQRHAVAGAAGLAGAGVLGWNELNVAARQEGAGRRPGTVASAPERSFC